jgi:hypothetical protein
MKENELLNRTLETIKSEGVVTAYNYLVNNLDKINELSSQVYNYLYCLAATSERKNEALDWLEEAIIKGEMWYRPEVFEDEDLDSIRDDNRYTNCYNISKERYLQSLKTAKPICTWKTKKADNLLLILHGNQQNIEICKESWDSLESGNYQVEYLQSKELDSYQLYRWEEEGEGPNQLKEAIDYIDWNNYNNRILCGFSSGCNVILRGISDYDINCDKIILQSPWIPVIEDRLEEVVNKIKEKNIEMLIICGEEDEDCLYQNRLLSRQAQKEGVNVEAIWIKDLGHDYPHQFTDIVTSYLKK